MGKQPQRTMHDHIPLYVTIPMFFLLAVPWVGAILLLMLLSYDLVVMSYYRVKLRVK